jgi:hypothetical protein
MAGSCVAHIATGRMLRIAVMVGFGLALGACSKCDVPDWFHTTPAPHACHGGPPA